LYREVPSLLPGPDACNHLDARLVPAGYQVLSYEQQKQCPHLQNLVGIFGIHDLQIEGTGASPADVVFDAQFQKLNVIRGDRTDGLYLRNFTAERSTFNAIYVIEIDGFVMDGVVGRWNTEYGFLSFAADHGLFTNCEAYGNGDSGIYPGGTSDINGTRGFDVPRYAIEVRGCHSHDNTLGYSGTGGDSAWVHDNVFDHNMGGASMDSLFPNHPGLPQNHALFEHNRIFSNNQNYYHYVTDGTCRRPILQRGIEQGVVCPAVPVPVGTGVVIAGGHHDTFRENWVYDNWKAGFIQVWVPGLVHGDNRLEAVENTSNYNRYLDNQMGRDPDGRVMPNRLDFFWDGQGVGNCWQVFPANTLEPLTLPACPGSSVARLVADPNRIVLFVDCSNYDLATQTLPAGCDWFTTPARPGSLSGAMNVQSVVPALQLLVVLVILIWRRRGVGLFVAGTALAACLVLLAASLEELYYLNAAGILILGLAWLMSARLAPRRGLAVLSAALGVVALFEAVDSGLLLLPLPVGPVWMRVVLEVVWVVWALAIAIRRPRPKVAAVPA